MRYIKLFLLRYKRKILSAKVSLFTNDKHKSGTLTKSISMVYFLYVEMLKLFALTCNNSLWNMWIGHGIFPINALFGLNQ